MTKADRHATHDRGTQLTGRNMRKIEVADISIDNDGRLLVRPRQAEDTFQYVYRAAAEVNWDEGQACFATPRPREWSYLEWFQHARLAIRSELGRDFEIGSRTTWVNIPDALRAEITSALNAG
jgi:hypothetical protein